MLVSALLPFIFVAACDNSQSLLIVNETDGVIRFGSPGTSSKEVQPGKSESVTALIPKTDEHRSAAHVAVHDRNAAGEVIWTFQATDEDGTVIWNGTFTWPEMYDLDWTMVIK